MAAPDGHDPAAGGDDVHADRWTRNGASVQVHGHQRLSMGSKDVPPALARSDERDRRLGHVMIPSDVFESIPGAPTAADVPDCIVRQRRVEKHPVGQFLGRLVLGGLCPEEPGDLFCGQWCFHLVAFRLRRLNTVGPSLTWIF